MATVQRYTLADVKLRDGKGNNPVWIVYKDSVYDITNYMDEHPAGQDMILEEAGTDSTKAFDESHTPDAKRILAKYKIGELVEEEKRFDANGKKKKKVVASHPEKNNRSCFNVITCGLVG